MPTIDRSVKETTVCPKCRARAGEDCKGREEPHAARVRAYRDAHPVGGAREGAGGPRGARKPPTRIVSTRIPEELAARFDELRGELAEGKALEALVARAVAEGRRFTD